MLLCVYKNVDYAVVRVTELITFVYDDDNALSIVFYTAIELAA